MKHYIKSRKNKWALKDAYFKSASKQDFINAVYYKQFVRAKRNKRNLPDSWDDIYPSRFYVTSWKDRSKQKRQWSK